MIALTLKGQTVANFHATLAGYSTTPYDRNLDWLKKAQALEDSVNTQILSCYENLESFIETDVSDSKYQDVSYLSDGSNAMLTDLAAKYPWIDWIVYGYNGERNSIVGNHLMTVYKYFFRA